MTSITEIGRSSGWPGNLDDADDETLARIPVMDQGATFGFACDHTETLMPAPIYLAHRLAQRLSRVRRDGELPYLMPHAKTQVGVEFVEDRPRRIHSRSIVASQYHPDEPSARELEDDLREHVIRPTFAELELQPDSRTKYFINPFGPVVGGGPSLHAGLTGGKTAVDTYGEFARSSGSALSGKGPSRIDRVGNYAGRYAAKNVVAAGLARACEIQLSYSIGQPGPVSLQVETFGTGRLSEEEIGRRVERHFDFRLGAIIGDFELRRPPERSVGGFDEKLAVFGQFGRPELQLPWELTDQVDRLRE